MKFGTHTPRDTFYQRAEFHLPPPTRSIGCPIPLFPLPIFFVEGRGTHRPQSPRLPRYFSKERCEQTERGRTSKFCRQMSRVMYYRSTKFHGHPIMSSIGSPVSIFPLPVPPDLFRRGPRDSSASVASAFPPLFFSWTARENGEREKAAIQYADPSCHPLPLHQVSAQSLHSIYRLPDP